MRLFNPLTRRDCAQVNLRWLILLRQRECIGMVAELGDRIAGFMIYELHKSRLELLNLAVAKDARRQGVGSAMVERLRDKLSEKRRWEARADVRESNTRAQLFLRATGWRCCAIKPGIYADSGESAYRFRMFAEPEHPGIVPFGDRGLGPVTA